MNKDDQEVLKEVQKNARMAMKAIDTISDKVTDDKLAYELSKENLIYSSIHNKAVDALTKQKAPTYHKSSMQDLMLEGGIHMNTLTNTSSSKIAEMVIQGSNRGIVSMYKSLNHHQGATTASMEVAKELMDFEEKCIERLKEYL